MEYFFSKILKSGICPWFEEWSYFPWTFHFIWNELYLHFVETKNLRVDSSGDLDFPQLENSLQVKPFLLTPRHKKTQIQKLTHTLCHHLYPSHLCRTSHVTLKSLRSLRCRLELGKNTVNSNSTTGLFVFIFSFLRQTFSPSDKLRERRATQQSRDCNLAIILISTVVMFFLCHLPRVVTRLVIFTLLWSPSPTPWPTASSPTQSSAFMRRRTSTPSSIAGKEVYFEF